MDRAAQSRLNADELARVLERGRDQVDASADEPQRWRHAQAVEQFAHYLDLLREATVGTGCRYFFKLDFADGRWSLDEQELAAAPRVGDLVQLSDGKRWRIRGSQLVQPRPPGKPPREFFVCAPVA